MNAASSKQQLAGHELELASFTQELNLYATNEKKNTSEFTGVVKLMHKVIETQAWSFCLVVMLW